MLEKWCQRNVLKTLFLWKRDTHKPFHSYLTPFITLSYVNSSASTLNTTGPECRRMDSTNTGFVLTPLKILLKILVEIQKRPYNCWMPIAQKMFLLFLRAPSSTRHRHLGGRGEQFNVQWAWPSGKKENLGELHQPILSRDKLLPFSPTRQSYTIIIVWYLTTYQEMCTKTWE